MTRLKICGVKTPVEARLLRDSGVDLIGLNFIPSSRRHITLQTAEAIMAELVGVQTVALFAGRPVAEVNEYAARLGVDFVQLHGNEDAAYARQVKRPVIRAVPVAPTVGAGELVALIKQFPADYFVLDRPQQGQGVPVDLSLARAVIKAVPDKIFLAGGLGPDNLADVLAEVQPYGIDIAGGVRDRNDELDPAQVAHCVAAVKRSST